MSSWDTKVSKSTMDTASSMNSLVDGRQSARSGLSKAGAAGNELFGSGALGAFGGIVQYKVVGINANGIEDIRSEITNYVTRIQKYLSQIGENALTSNAFRGEEAEAAVKNYIEVVKTYCSNLTSQLYAFDDKLVEVKQKWDAAQKNMGTNVDTSRTGFNEGQAYR